MQTVGIEGFWFHLWKISVACACRWALVPTAVQGPSAARALMGAGGLGSTNGP